MRLGASRLGVGGPHVFVGDGWDVAPIVLAVAILVLLRSFGLRVRGAALLVALGGGLILDLVTDAGRLRPATVIAVLGIASGVVALRRMHRV